MKYNYKLVRSARKTISVTVSADNSIIVRAPYKASDERIEKFLQSKSIWLDKKLEENNRILFANSSVKSFKTILVAGEEVPLVIGESNGVKSGSVYIKNLSRLQKVLCDNYREEFIARFDNTARVGIFKVASVGFRSYKARWGCCDSSGNIVFNYKILMLPVELQDYIIIHELCHLKYMNHSPTFWAEVKRLCPEYQSRRKRLKEYAFLTRLYP